MSTQTKETTPDQLMEAFHGRSFKSIILFTLIVHVVVIGGTSIPYVLKSVTGRSESKLSEEERTEIAAREATSALSDIAAKHGLKPQDLSTRIAGGAAPVAPAAPAASPPKEAPAPTEQPPAPAPVEPEKPRSVIEEKIEVREEGPKVPPIPTEEADDEDLFE